MPATDPRVTVYISASAPFARPILRRLRATVHGACPEAEETIKWGFPHFTYRGQILCSMASFTRHCAFGFWRRDLVQPAGTRGTEAMGQLGRITSSADLPSRRELSRCVKQAMGVIEAGPAAPPRIQRPPELAMPKELTRVLARNAKARKAFEGFPPSHRREYLEWITEAKRPETRARRVATTVAWLAEAGSARGRRSSAIRAGSARAR